MKIVFMCNSKFGIPSLNILLRNNSYTIYVLTKKSNIINRNYKNSFFYYITNFCLKRKIKLIYYNDINDTAIANNLKDLNADLFIVISFDIIPYTIFSMPNMGTINLHPSLLPQYKGAAPIHWAIINGESVTGLTIFFINDKIDSGDIISQVSIKITYKDNYGTLYHKLSNEGANLILSTMNFFTQKKKYDNKYINKLNLISSNKKAPKIYPNDCWICWNNNGQNIINIIRGLSPLPGAKTIFNKKQIKIFDATFIAINRYIISGQIITDYKKFIKITSCDGYINIKILQLESSKKMNVENFLRGYYHKL